MVLDEPLHCALSVMTLIALAGPRGPRTGPETAAESELPTTGINRALRDLTAARLLTVELEAACIGYAATKPPSVVMIAGIIEVAHAPCRRRLAEREEGARDEGLRGEPSPRSRAIARRAPRPNAPGTARWSCAAGSRCPTCCTPRSAVSASNPAAGAYSPMRATSSSLRQPSGSVCIGTTMRSCSISAALTWSSPAFAFATLTKCGYGLLKGLLVLALVLVAVAAGEPAFADRGIVEQGGTPLGERCGFPAASETPSGWMTLSRSRLSASAAPTPIAAAARLSKPVQRMSHLP